MKYRELVLTQGDSYRMRVTLRSSTGFPVDVANAEVDAAVYDTQLGKIVTLQVDKTDAASGTFVLYLSEEETAALPATTTSSTLSWGLKIRKDGTTTTLAKGQCLIREGFAL